MHVLCKFCGRTETEAISGSLEIWLSDSEDDIDGISTSRLKFNFQNKYGQDASIVFHTTVTV